MRWILAVAPLLSACGQSGALYLPDEPAAVTPAEPTAPAEPGPGEAPPPSPDAAAPAADGEDAKD